MGADVIQFYRRSFAITYPARSAREFAQEAAESTGDWTLVGCTVAPGFDFSTFEMAPEDWEPT